MTRRVLHSVVRRIQLAYVTPMRTWSPCRRDLILLKRLFEHSLGRLISLSQTASVVITLVPSFEGFLLSRLVPSSFALPLWKSLIDRCMSKVAESRFEAAQDETWAN